MIDPTCDFHCVRFLAGRLAEPVCLQNEQVCACHHADPLGEYHVVRLPRRHIGCDAQLRSS